MTTLAELRAEQKRRYEAERQAVLDVTPAPELTLRDWQATRDGVEEVDLTADGEAMPDVEEVPPPQPPPETGGGRALGGSGDRPAGMMTMQHMRPAVDVGDEIREEMEKKPKREGGRRLDGERDERDDMEYFTVTVKVILWEDGFEVSLPGDGTLPTGERVFGVTVGQYKLPFGALHKYNDLRYEAFMKQVRMGKCPQELNQLTKWLPGPSHIHLSIVDRANIKHSLQRAPTLVAQAEAKPELKVQEQPEEDGRPPSPQAAAGSEEPAKTEPTKTEPAAPAGRTISRTDVIRARLIAKLGKDRAASLEPILKAMPEQEAAELVRAPAMLDIRLREWEAAAREEQREREFEEQLLRDLREKAAAQAKQASQQNGTKAPVPAPTPTPVPDPTPAKPEVPAVDPSVALREARMAAAKRYQQQKDQAISDAKAEAAKAEEGGEGEKQVEGSKEDGEGADQAPDVSGEEAKEASTEQPAEGKTETEAAATDNDIAPRPPVAPRPRVERRVDPSDGQAYTRQQFTEAYGDDSEQHWADAETRVDESDGQRYTKQQFIECYGDEQGPEKWEAAAPKDDEEIDASEHDVKGQRRKVKLKARAPTTMEATEDDLALLRKQYEKPREQEDPGEDGGPREAEKEGEEEGTGGRALGTGEGQSAAGLAVERRLARVQEQQAEDARRRQQLEEEAVQEEILQREAEMDLLRRTDAPDEEADEVMGPSTTFPRRKGLQDALDWLRLLAVVFSWKQKGGGKPEGEAGATSLGLLSVADLCDVCASMPEPRFYFDSRLRGDFDPTCGPYRLRCSPLDETPVKGGICIVQPALAPGKITRARFRFGGFFGRASGTRTHVGVLRVVHPAKQQTDALVRTQFMSWGAVNLPHLVAADVAGGVHPKTTDFVEGGAGRRRTQGGDREGKTGLRASAHPVIDVEVNLGAMVFSVGDGSGKRWSAPLFRLHAESANSQATFHLVVGLGALACGEAFVDILPANGRTPPGRPLAWQLSRKTAVALDMDGYELPYKVKQLAPPDSWGVPMRVALGRNEKGETIALKSVPADDIQCDFERLPPRQRDRLGQMFGLEDEVPCGPDGVPLDLSPEMDDGATDWECPSCQAFNFKDKDECFKCGAPRPKGKTLGGAKRDEDKKQDLKCRSCGGSWPCNNPNCAIGEFLSQNPVLPYHWERHHGPMVPLGEEGTGTVRRWDEDRKFGFIRPDENEEGERGPDLFVHISSFEGSALKVGEKVSFRKRDEPLTGKARAEQVTGDAIVGWSAEELMVKGKGMKGKKGKDGKGKGFGGKGFGQQTEQTCHECNAPYFGGKCTNEQCFKSRPRRTKGPGKGLGRGQKLSANPEGRTIGAIAGRGGQAVAGKKMKETGGYCCGCGAGGVLLRPSPQKVGLGPGLYCETCIAKGHMGEGPGGRGKGLGRGTIPSVGVIVGRGRGF